jgi:ABC-2 type transport system ATP-binding protein
MALPIESPPAVEVVDLVKRYPKAPANAVDGVTFSVRQGEIFGLLGPNGAGKTTTIGVLTTRVRPTSGSASIVEHSVTADPIAVKQRIAVVPQQMNLDRSLNVRSILTFHGAYHSVPRAQRTARADDLLAELGLTERAKDDVDHYSGGMNQRLMIARALMHDPDVLFLDEPTNNLDPQSRRFLWERIRALNAKGLTIVLTTHDMEEADQLCDRIAIMDRGKILVNDTSDALKRLIPGGTTLELRVTLPNVGAESISASDDGPEHLRTALAGLPGVTQVDLVPVRVSTDQAENERVTAFNVHAPDAGGVVAGANEVILNAGARLRDLHIRRPSLEDVFIHLTGRDLRS